MPFSLPAEWFKIQDIINLKKKIKYINLSFLTFPFYNYL